MEFKILVAVVEPWLKPWWEVHDNNDVRTLEDVIEWGKKAVKEFNNTLRPKEKKRTFIAAKILNANSRKEHDWKKQNLVTLSGSIGLYDKYKCIYCGTEAQRYGLSETISPNNKAKVYQRCDTAKEHFEQLANRRKKS